MIAAVVGKGKIGLEGEVEKAERFNSETIFVVFVGNVYSEKPNRLTLSAATQIHNTRTCNAITYNRELFFLKKCPLPHHLV